MNSGDPLCGEYGPKFVGYGPELKLSWWQRWRETAGIALGIFSLSLILMAIL